MDKLDRIIAEQAAYYGLTVEQFERASRCMAAIAESVTETDEIEGRVIYETVD